MARNSSKYLPPLVDHSASVTGFLESRCLEIVDMMAKWETDNNIRKKAIKAEDLFEKELINENEYEKLKKQILGIE